MRCSLYIQRTPPGSCTRGAQSKRAIQAKLRDSWPGPKIVPTAHRQQRTVPQDNYHDFNTEDWLRCIRDAPQRVIPPMHKVSQPSLEEVNCGAPTGLRHNARRLIRTATQRQTNYGRGLKCCPKDHKISTRGLELAQVAVAPRWRK